MTNKPLKHNREKGLFSPKKQKSHFQHIRKWPYRIIQDMYIHIDPSDNWKGILFLPQPLSSLS